MTKRNSRQIPVLLDLFCGAGGCSVGYNRAGFDVIGVDIEPQPRYPFEFVQGDALEYLAAHGCDFDFIHASPPCQEYSTTRSLHSNSYPDLVGQIRAALISTGKPYAIENVMGSPLLNPIKLCGSMFGLSLIRHRLFETNPVIWFPPSQCYCDELFTNSHRNYSSFANGATAITVAGNNYNMSDGKAAMGIDWMVKKELSQAIPPVYTEWIGRQILAQIQSETAVTKRRRTTQ